MDYNNSYSTPNVNYNNHNQMNVQNASQKINELENITLYDTFIISCVCISIILFFFFLAIFL